ncbi:MAG: UTP--glucose-1-phosphate uridylyltransferase [Phycisphaerae bacterium]|nr:UTP--glucose-1-phosphate uridylyltransferase [Phycisphaerae bacterium]
MTTLNETKQRLERTGQAHLLAFWDTLDEKRRAHLLAEVARLPLEHLSSMLAQSASLARPSAADIRPVRPYLTSMAEAERFHAIGVDMLRRGRVAAFVVAGGQGTRLGWRGPKGTFPATPVTGKPLFRVFAEQILASEKKYGVTIPWYVMTSEANHEDTERFFVDNRWFNRPPQSTMLFTQGMVPSVDTQGKVLLEDPWQPALNPDGHGGSLKALLTSGALEHMRSLNIEHLCYFQVDNPNVHVIDPLFVGLHVAAPDSSAEMSSKSVPKRGPEEKVGIFVKAPRLTVIEYSDAPREVIEARDSQGELVYGEGSIAIHVIGVEFIRRMTDHPLGSILPWHRALKKVPFYDRAAGARVEPAEANAIKLETFIFDALKEAESPIVLRTDRVEEFAPIKNASGDDSAATSKALQSERAARWLIAAGVAVPMRADGQPDCTLEISPLTALEAADLLRNPPTRAIAAGSEALL